MPELAVAAAEGERALRGAGKGGNLREREEGEDAELDIFRELHERNLARPRIHCRNRKNRPFWIDSSNVLIEENRIRKKPNEVKP